MASLWEYSNERAGAKLIIEDDDKTAYAYLIVDNQLTGDVWLYNIGPSPEEPEWTDPENMPFANPSGFASDETFDPIEDHSDIRLEWVIEGDEVEEVVVFLRGTKHALLRPGSQPGWCRLAVNNGPLAKPF